MPPLFIIGHEVRQQLPDRDVPAGDVLMRAGRHLAESFTEQVDGLVIALRAGALAMLLPADRVRQMPRRQFLPGVAREPPKDDARAYPSLRHEE